MEALALSTKTAGYDTRHDRNALATGTRPSKALRNLVDLVEFEPTSLFHAMK